MKTKKIMIAFTLLCLVLLLSSSALAVPTTITIDYKIPCDAAMQTMTLGSFTPRTHNVGPTDGEDNDQDGVIDEADETNYCLDATFTVAAGVQKGQPGSHGIWNCMDLHWLQTIWNLDTTDLTIAGAQPQLPIIDLPVGGWDNMYNDLDTPPDGIQSDERISSNVTDPQWEDDARDTDPWYWTAEEEAAGFVTEGVSYYFGDDPTDLTAPNYMGFSTYLCAVATQVCEPLPPECLDKNQILVLGGFDWTINSALINVQHTFSEATAGDVAEIGVALGTAGFSGWSVTGDKAICCIPAPGALILASMGVGVVGWLRRRRTL